MQRFQLGEVEVTKVVEWQGDIAPARVIIPDSPPEIWQNNASWLAPDHWRPDTDAYHAAVQTWVLRSEGKTILIDTGVGNDRDRPQSAPFDRLNTDFLDRLAETGVRPQDVDVVINTHIHYDHVGLEHPATQRRVGADVPQRDLRDPAGGSGVLRPPQRPPPPDAPRQPRAMPQRRQPHRLRRQRRTRTRPGRALGGHVPHRRQPQPGARHRPHSRLFAHPPVIRSDRAVFVGDLLHGPVQILEPHDNSCFCEDPAQAAVTRRSVLERAADTR